MKKVSDPKFKILHDLFKSKGVDFVDADTGEKIEYTDPLTMVFCPYCDGENSPTDKNCGWCQNSLEE